MVPSILVTFFAFIITLTTFDSSLAFLSKSSTSNIKISDKSMSKHPFNDLPGDVRSLFCGTVWSLSFSFKFHTNWHVTFFNYAIKYVQPSLVLVTNMVSFQSSSEIEKKESQFIRSIDCVVHWIFLKATFQNLQNQLFYFYSCVCSFWMPA